MAYALDFTFLPHDAGIDCAVTNGSFDWAVLADDPVGYPELSQGGESASFQSRLTRSAATGASNGLGAFSEMTFDARHFGSDERNNGHTSDIVDRSKLTQTGREKLNRR
jgi:hypothetical protein